MDSNNNNNNNNSNNVIIFDDVINFSILSCQKSIFFVLKIFNQKLTEMS